MQTLIDQHLSIGHRISKRYEYWIGYDDFKSPKVEKNRSFCEHYFEQIYLAEQFPS